MNDALLVTFGPMGDRLFITALALIIFVNGVTAVLWVVAEVQNAWQKFRGTKPVEKPAREILYEVQWSFTGEFEYIQTRIANSIEHAVVELTKENYEGYIRYRPYDGVNEWPWGISIYRDLSYIENDGLYSQALSAMQKHADEWTEEDLHHNDVAMPTPEESENRSNYIVQWSNNPEFSEAAAGGIVTAFVTQYPETKIREIVKSLGSGYIRYNLSTDDSGTWIPNGYVTKEMVNA